MKFSILPKCERHKILHTFLSNVSKYTNVHNTITLKIGNGKDITQNTEEQQQIKQKKKSKNSQMVRIC